MYYSIDLIQEVVGIISLGWIAIPCSFHVATSVNPLSSYCEFKLVRLPVYFCISLAEQKANLLLVEYTCRNTRPRNGKV